MLAAYSLGLGTVWLSAGRHPQAREIPKAPAGCQVVAVVPVGYPAMIPPGSPREPAAGRLRRLP